MRRGTAAKRDTAPFDHKPKLDNTRVGRDKNVLHAGSDAGELPHILGDPRGFVVVDHKLLHEA